MSDAAGVVGHYGSGDLRAAVDAALARAGLDGPELDWRKLAPLDQFHVGGLKATADLAAGLGVAAGDNVIDIGCGIGGAARFLAASFGCDVTGVDLNQNYIGLAGYLSERTGLAAQTRFRQADALDLPFADGAFDLALTQHVAMNIADRARFYAGIYRVLKPGGRLAIYDATAGEGGPVIFPVPWARQPAMSFLLTPAAMRAALLAAGFTERAWTDKTAEGLASFAAQQAARRAEPAPLGIQVLMGPGFGEMAGNFARNLREGRVQLTQVIVQKA